MKGKKDKLPKEKKEKILPEKMGPGEKPLKNIPHHELLSDVFDFCLL